jgi:uncharacterized protein YqeY
MHADAGVTSTSNWLGQSFGLVPGPHRTWNGDPQPTVSEHTLSSRCWMGLSTTQRPERRAEMPLLNEFNTRLKDAMKGRRADEVNVIRMIKSRIMERQTSASFTGEMDDKVVLEVIATYVKQMTKALAEYEKLGEQAASHIDGIKFEIEYLSPFLPQKLGADETFELVSRIRGEEGIEDSRMIGKLIGAVMRSHRDQVDPNLVRAAAARLLS